MSNHNIQLELFDPDLFKKDVEIFCDRIEDTIEQRNNTRVTKLKTISLPVEEVKSLISYVRTASLLCKHHNKEK